VVDDGIGIAEGPSAGEGLRNMSTRASNLGGRCTVSRRHPTGTLVEWRVPACSRSKDSQQDRSSPDACLRGAPALLTDDTIAVTAR
jgi:signal transduction histidine kinase